jgi:hypothetical protein
MQSEPDAISRMLLDDAQRGNDGDGQAGSRDDVMRVALQKKRWIEMQLHAVRLSSVTCDV